MLGPERAVHGILGRIGVRSTAILELPQAAVIEERYE